jgi:hypothetical protein
VDRKGNVRMVKVGFSQAEVPKLKAEIEKLINEK